MTYLNHRNQQIDFLRGIAIISVLILHFNLSYHLAQSALSSIFSIDFIERMAGNGNYGVTMFFVISGFLITSTSLERFHKIGKIDVIGFYILRAARIMPCLLLALALIIFFNFLHIPIFENKPDTTSLFLAVFSVLTFWHNLLMAKIGYFNYCLNIFWSLSVEEIFYIAFPLICFFFKKTRFIIPFWIALIIIGPIYRSYYTNNEIVVLEGYFSCFDAIALGCSAAIVTRKIILKESLKNILRYSAWALIIVTYFYSGILENVVMGVSLIALGTAILLISVNEGESEKNRSAIYHFVCWFGKNSYELYLFHIIVLALMKEICARELLGDYTKLLWMAVFFSISALFSGIIAKYYSNPLNRRLRESLINLSHSRGCAEEFPKVAGF
jgi:peptidoglycan/LPS O-acetylase OafA/YrhL